MSSGDTGATVTDAGKTKLTLGKGSAEKVVVKYPSEGGYAPGDTWELHEADGKPAHVSFSNVAVKLVGSSNWMDAH